MVTSVSSYRSGNMKFGTRNHLQPIHSEVKTYMLSKDELEKIRRETGYMKMPSMMDYLNSKVEGKSDSEFKQGFGIDINQLNKLKKQWGLIGKFGPGKDSKSIALQLIKESQPKFTSNVVSAETKPSKIELLNNKNPTLPREVASEIEKLRRTYDDWEIIIRADKCHVGTEIIAGWIRKDRTKNATFLIQSLANGYEIERTPEERIAEAYRNAIKDNQQFADGMSYVLDVYGINIIGVNMSGPVEVDVV